jgi:hypothetical protein
MKICALALVASVILTANVPAQASSKPRPFSPIRIAQSNGTCSGPGDERFPYGTRLCFCGEIIIKVCTDDGTDSGLWVPTTQRCNPNC